MQEAFDFPLACGCFDRQQIGLASEITTARRSDEMKKMAPKISRLPRSLLTLAHGFDTIW